MTKQNERRLYRRVRAHRERVMIECADNGHGCDHERAIKSEIRLIEFIEQLVANEAGRICEEVSK